MNKQREGNWRRMPGRVGDRLTSVLLRLEGLAIHLFPLS